MELHIQPSLDSAAPYFIEEVRRYLENKYGSDEVHQAGLRVYTTLNAESQKAANRAVLDGLALYERRHGWKGNLKHIDPSEMGRFQDPDWSRPIEIGSYVHGVVTNVFSSLAMVKLGSVNGSIIMPEMSWTGVRNAEKLLGVGDIVYVRVLSMTGGSNSPVPTARLALEQDAGAQGALLALDNATGDIKAMIGGRDFDESKFNRATQALRQVGSAFKPYVYTAAIEAGAKPEDIIEDVPTTFITSSGLYTPRQALAESRNIPALKLAERVGMKSVINYAQRFGISSRLEPLLPVALGSAEITLQEQVAAFTAFPNDGIRVTPRYIRKVVDYDGRVLEENYPEVKDVISQRTARTMTGLLREVVLHGTAATAAAKLNHHSLGGKTGTTNDYTDAWFLGFSPSITCGVWVGFDEKKTLGATESGAQTALPIWINFMKAALAGRDAEQFPGDQRGGRSQETLKAQARPSGGAFKQIGAH